MKRIEIIVDSEGRLELQTKGFQGRDCLAATRDLERLLGEVADEQLTHEFYRQGASCSVNEQRLSG